MTRFVEDIIQFCQNLFEMILGVFDFELFGKNIRLELIDTLEAIVLVAFLLFGFKVILSKTDSIIGKIILISLFVFIYLFAQIWVF